MLFLLFACTKPTADGSNDDSGGVIDSEPPCEELTWYVDGDGDGVGGSDTIEACEAPNGAVDVTGDCNDANADVFPDAAEVCNGLDDDCDGLIDDDDDSVDTSTMSTFHPDADEDGYGDGTVDVQACGEGDGVVADGTDCDDADWQVHPGADEICNDLDDDCDDQVDEDALDASTWYADFDTDDHGDPSTSKDACDQPDGYVADDTDCDDTRFETNPLADELCNDVDDDCDGDVDVDALDAPTWYTDSDTDGYGDVGSSTVTCDQPTGMVSDDTDCDDGDSDTNPAADEYCDGHDDDCDGDVDEAGALDADTWYIDSDGDGYGDASTYQVACDEPSGYASAGGDCDDANADRNPGEAEICDGFDNDCNGSTSEDGLASFDDGSGWVDTTLSGDVTLSSDGALMICDGTYYVNLDIDADVEIYSESGDETAVVLDGSSSGSVLHVDGSYAVYVDDLTIQNGDADEYIFLGGSWDGGGGIACLDGSLSVSNVVFDANSGSLGGNLTLESCDTDLFDVTVTDPTGTYGAQAFVTDSYLYVDGSTFSGGTATYGGIYYLYNYSGSDPELEMVDSSYSDNETTAYYGNIYNSAGSDITCDGTSFTNNVGPSSSYGDVITSYSSSATLSVTDCDFGTLSAGDDNIDGGADIYWVSDFYEAGDGVTFECTSDCGTYTTTDTASGTSNAYSETYANIFLATEDATLHTMSAQLYRSGCSATLFVAASDSATSGYELEFISSSTSLSSSLSDVSAGTVDIAIEDGRYYILGATSSCDIYQRYSYSGGTDPDWGSKYGYAYVNSQVTGSVGDSVSLSTYSSTTVYFDHDYEYTVLD